MRVGGPQVPVSMCVVLEFNFWYIYRSMLQKLVGEAISRCFNTLTTLVETLLNYVRKVHI